MAAGTFTTQNKVRPGVYINFKSEAQSLGSVGDRGIATMALPLSWGEPNKVISIEAGENVFSKLGYAISDSEILLVREALKRAKTLLLYRLNSGTKATATSGTLTITAKWGGIRGNDIDITIAENVDDETKFDVTTIVDGTKVDTQIVANVEGLVANEWVVFSGTGALSASAGIPLIGGADGSVTNQNYVDYMAAIEILDFNTMAVPVTDNSLKSLFVSFCKRLREDEGKKVQVVLENYPNADYEGVISVKNGVILSDGTTLSAAQCTAWVAGATARAQINESLTYDSYDDALDVTPKYTNTQIIAGLEAGEFLFTASNGKAVVEQDINTLTGFTAEKGKAFSKNRVMRVLDGINKDLVDLFNNFYIGKVSNNADGRNLLKNECINYFVKLQGVEAIQNFDSQTDISIQQGDNSDSVYIETNTQPVDSIEKIYMKVQVK